MEAIEPRKSLVDETYEALLDAICTGELPAGTRLNQDEIAARLNVSRQPVNSAISILRAHRFVEDNGRRGTVVSEASIAHFQSIVEFRGVIEPFAVTLAGQRLPDTARDDAARILDRGQAAVATGTVRDLLQADMDFHAMLYRWSGNPVVDSSMRINWHHTRRFMAEALRDPQIAESSWDDHSRIVTHLLDGNIAEATGLMRDHIDRARRKVLHALPADTRCTLTRTAAAGSGPR